ncbi:MAG: restriction endonuclease subunit S [Candidatus Methanoperedens sp.]|nr:restriction endonuclease subunit S [Candidatus Methanoperedens sp.]
MIKYFPENWKLLELKDIFEIKKGKKVNITNNKNIELMPYVGIGNLRGVPISQYSSDKNGLVCEKNDILLVWDGANFGTVGTGLSGFVGSTIVRLRLVDSSVNTDYAYRFLKSKFKYFNSTTTGATIPHLDKKKVHGLKIPIPPLPVQKKIAGILEKAEKLKTWRAEADKLTDEFLKSTFLEMFGDPVTNPMGWEIKKLEAICSEIYRYPTFYGFEYTKIGVPVVRINNIFSNGSLDPDVSNYVFIEPKLNENFPRTILEFNDIVMAVRGDGSTAKRIGLVDTINLLGANISPNLIRFKANTVIMNPFYLFILMTSDSGQKLLEKYVTRTAKKTITAKDIKTIPIPLPPLPLQQKFAAIVRQVEQMRQYQQESKAHIDDLFNALMQKAFKGELVA